MKILSWNVGRCGKERFSSQLKEEILYCNPDMVLLLETKVQPEKTKKITKAFNYSNFTAIPTEGLSGGLW